MHPAHRPVAVIAHRGASAYAPEHTLQAYDLALSMGADRLEIDVRPLADGTLAVVHDTTLARVAGDPRTVRECTRADVAALPDAVRPLLLDELLEHYGTRARYLIELKSPGPGDGLEVLRAVERHGLDGAGGHVHVQSFDHDALRRLRLRGATVPLSPLYVPGLPGWVLRRALARAARWATAITPCATSVDAAVVAGAHARGLAVAAYTVNEDAEMARLAACGVDAIITDVPDRVRAAVGGAVPVEAVAA